MGHDTDDCSRHEVDPVKEPSKPVKPKPQPKKSLPICPAFIAAGTVCPKGASRCPSRHFCPSCKRNKTHRTGCVNA
jgi:hypothetical protein